MRSAIGDLTLSTFQTLLISRVRVKPVFINLAHKQLLESFLIVNSFFTRVSEERPRSQDKPLGIHLAYLSWKFIQILFCKLLFFVDGWILFRSIETRLIFKSKHVSFVFSSLIFCCNNLHNESGYIFFLLKMERGSWFGNFRILTNLILKHSNIH